MSNGAHSKKHTRLYSSLDNMQRQQQKHSAPQPHEKPQSCTAKIWLTQMWKNKCWEIAFEILLKFYVRRWTNISYGAPCWSSERCMDSVERGKGKIYDLGDK